MVLGIIRAKRFECWSCFIFWLHYMCWPEFLQYVIYEFNMCYMFSATPNQGNRRPVKFGGHRRSESRWEGKWRGGAIGATQMD